MRKNWVVLSGALALALAVVVTGCNVVPVPGGNTNGNDNSMNSNDNMNDNGTANDNMNDNGTANDNTNANGGGMTGGDATAGMAFYTDNGCNVCHGDDATGGIGPSLVGVSATEILERNDGTESHPGGTVDGITQADADNVAAFIASL